MAAVSAPHAASVPPQAFNPSVSQSSWHFTDPASNEKYDQASNTRRQNGRQAYSNGNSSQNSLAQPNYSQRRADTYDSTHSTSSRQRQQQEQAYLASVRGDPGRKDMNSSGGVNSTDRDPHDTPSAYDTYTGEEPDDSQWIHRDKLDQDDPDNSRWIHREKLLKIEHEELEAAGITLPPQQVRKASKTRKASRSRSRDKLGNGQRRKGSIPLPHDGDSQWDLRTAQEAAENNNSQHGSGARGTSRIPKPKVSAIPVPVDHAGKSSQRNKSGSWEGQEDDIPIQKARGRSHSVKALHDSTITQGPRRIATDGTSPPKKAATPRKASAPAGRTAKSASRPAVKNGAKARATSNQRPNTRSGENGPGTKTKRPEGDPPWLAMMYKPDPRLPPDQQLIPTVAKRLQQEQWEKEGKFGTTYEKDFRPSNDQPFGGYPDPSTIPGAMPPDSPPQDEHRSPIREDGHGQSSWPMSQEQQANSQRPTTSSGDRSGSYSTMPNIATGKPQGIGPISSPKASQIEPPVITARQPTAKDDDEKKGGCGCCIVM